jgi:hypothetical protein
MRKPMEYIKKLKKEMLKDFDNESLTSKLFSFAIGFAVYSMIACIIYIIAYSFYSVWADFTHSLLRKFFWSAIIIAIIDFLFFKMLGRK